MIFSNNVRRQNAEHATLLLARSIQLILITGHRYRIVGEWNTLAKWKRRQKQILWRLGFVALNQALVTAIIRNNAHGNVQSRTTHLSWRVLPQLSRHVLSPAEHLSYCLFMQCSIVIRSNILIFRACISIIFAISSYVCQHPCWVCSFGIAILHDFESVRVQQKAAVIFLRI